MDFKKRVINRRKELGLSQSEVARALGYTAQGISKFELSDSSLPITILPALASTLKCNMGFLFGEEDETTTFSYPQIDLSLLGKKLRESREKKGLSEEKAATEIGISIRTLENYEKGDSSILSEPFEKALKLYGLKAEEALFPKEEVPARPKKTQTMEAIYNRRGRLSYYPRSDNTSFY